MRAARLLLLVTAGCGSVDDEDPERGPVQRKEPRVCADTAAPPASRVRRLTKLELGSAVSALFGEHAVQALANLDADPQIDGRYSNSDQLVASKSFLSGLRLAAERLAADFKTSVTQAAYDPACFASDVSGEACATSFIQDVGARAYRRTLTGEDVSSLLGVYIAGREAGVDGDPADRFATGLSWVVRAIVQSPDFLYLHQLGDPAAPSGAATRLLATEVAGALAFSVTGAPPDDALTSAAAEGRLSTPEERMAQAARLMTEAPAGYRRQLRLFVTQWLGINFEKQEWAKDPGLFPSFTPALKDALKAETELLIDDWAAGADGGRLETLLTSPSTFVSEANAPLYGVAALGSGFQKTALDPAQRAGILTLGGFLGSTSHAGETSPVLRGVVILERLLCRERPAPPTIIPPLPPAERTSPTTTRERYERHLSDPTCRGCHELFDPMGNAFEAYDALGGYRSHQNGVAVDGSGALVSADGQQTPVAGAVELVNLLARDPEVRACAARQLFRFVAGRDEVAYDECAIEQVASALAEGGVRGGVLAITGSEAFVMRQVGP